MKRPWLKQTLVLLLAAVLPAVAAGWLHPRRPAWDSMEVRLETVESWGGKVIWIDARPIAEFEKDHVPGALPLHEANWDEELPALLDELETGKTVVVYCSSLSCQTSHDVAKRLRDEVGLKEVRVLEGGWERWVKAKGAR